MERMNITVPQHISPKPTARTTTVETRVDPAERNTVTAGQTTETERCGSSLARLVQIPPTPVTPVVSMVIDTGDLEDQYRPMTPGEEEIMRIYEDGIYRTSRLDRKDWRIMDYWKDLTLIRAHLILIRRDRRDGRYRSGTG